ncbi:pitrilysin family protein [Flavivirga sp. 57AJ16]|uniref:M16 family metallopeptidase n=1 Tax=Flavivirga sp. 57AJ16 TaxID=3025307 RepID=UPI002365D135|nr:M16 family metallopeptidase [Flavivirga sp. 57AJ16]MDD7887501.1 insulinase family protein [Flavivirga sp. 57AJ16]
MKRILLHVLVSAFCFNALAQNLNLNAPLPVDQSIKKGVLPNGMTYYIHNTDVTKDVASYYIIQNVGSVLENDEQQGLAHFLEHMAFNGTENFVGKGILNTLQKHGLVFGRDINAYTSFDETVYNINNIPTTPELIDTGLLILHDWSNYLLLTEEEIDAERGVIKEEWRTRQSGGMRILQKSLPTMFNNTIYAERLPIGLMDIVDNFEYKALRDFYHDWYRTDLQAIAIIGDIDVNAMEEKIKKLFSKIPKVDHAKERFIVNIPDNDTMLYSMAMDEEVTTSQINFGIRHPKSLTNETVADLKQSLLNSLVTNMLYTRIDEITQKPDAPFLAMQVDYSSHSRATNALNVRVYPKPNEQHKAFKAALEVINRAVKFGFTTEEINRSILYFKNHYKTQISKKDDRSHLSIVSTIQQNYLENETMTDIAKNYELIEKIFDATNSKEIHNRLKQLYTAKNRFLTVTGVKGHNNLTKENALQIIKTVENDDTLVPYSDAFAGKTLISNLKIKKGKITKENNNKSLGSTTFVLSNGITVHYKFADKNKNDVNLNALSYGGTSLLKDEDLPSANLLANLVNMSGLGDYSSTDLTKVLAGKTASTDINLSGLSEGIRGSSVTKDVETMLQMVYLRFVKPRFDKDAYKVLMGNIDNYIIRRSNDINQKIGDSVTVAIYGKDHPKVRLFTTDYANDISFEKMKEIYLNRFNNASDFEFFIIGDIQKETLKPLLEKYIASIPTNNSSETWKDNSVDWVSTSIDKDVYLKMEDPKSSVRIAYKNDYEYNLKNKLIAQAVGDMLQLRFTETLREQEGGTYGASSYADVSKRPTQEASIMVTFDCNPDKVEQLIAIVHKELKKMANGDINQLDLEKTTTNYLKERKQQQDYNSYDMRLLVNYFREGYHMNHPENFEDIVKGMTIDDIKSFVHNVLVDAETYEIVIKPLK